MAASAEKPECRFIVLGASNVTRSISTVLETARAGWGQPLEFFAAAGHGRSYGATSLVLGRALPGILSSRLWDDLRDLPPLPTAALITDIGNDLMYGASPDQVARWVRQSLERLQQHTQRLTLSNLPLDSILRLDPLRFHFFRKLFVPQCRLSLAQLQQRAQELDSLLEELATRCAIPIVRQPGEWFGWDPIHLRRRVWRQAWPQLMRSLFDATPPAPRGSWARWLHLKRLRPAQRSLWGRLQYTAQPASCLHDGSTIWLY